MEKYTVEEAIADMLAEIERDRIKAREIYSLLLTYSDKLENNEDKYRLEKALWEKYPEYK